MFFTAPIFLWFLPLAGLPVIFHLLMKRREKRMEFPSLIFFIKADPRMHARRRLRELLLLAARVLFLLVLILALSRPILKKVPPVGGAGALVIVVDNSASMDGLTPDGQSKLEFAREAARQLLDALDENGRAAVTSLIADPALEPASQLTADRELLKENLERIRRTEAMGTPAQAFSRVRALLDQAPPAMGRAVHFFTDLHEAAWDRPGPGKTVFENTAVIFHRIPSSRRIGANIAIESVSTPNRALLPKHHYEADFVLRNNSLFSGSIRVNIRNSQDVLTSQKIMIEPGMSETVRHSFTPDEPGSYWIMLELEGDSFRGDNRSGIALFCKPEAEVWFIGERLHYGLIPTAISPAGTGRHTSLRPVFKTPENLMQNFSENPPPMIVGTWRHLAELPNQQVEELRKYVEAGGQLLVVPDTAGGAPPPSLLPAWLGAAPGVVTDLGDDPAVARIFNRDSTVWNGFHNNLQTGLPRFFLTHKYAELKLTHDYRILAGLNQRSPLMAERELGKGRIYVSGSAFDRQWTSLATDPSGIAVVMMHNIAKSGAFIMAGPKQLNIAAGEHIRIASAAEKPTRIRSLTGDTVNTLVPPGATLVPARAGAYRVESAGSTYLVSVRGSQEEASEVFLGDGNLALMGATPHHVTTLSSPDHDAVHQLRAHFTGRPLYLPLALLAFLAWAAEAWLASARSRAGKNATRIRD